MKTIIAAVIIALISVSAEARPVKVKEYRSKSGSVRKNHVRSAPNKSRLDNYGTKGRINPRSGKPGTKEPLRRQE